jgi:flagellar assembly protein FliH
MTPQANPDEPAQGVNLLDAARKADEVLMHARDQAKRLEEQSRAAAAQALEAARRQGYEDGFAKGEADGYAAGRQEALGADYSRFRAALAEQCKLASAIVSELAALRAKLQREAHQELLAFSLKLARQSVGEVRGDVTAARENLRKVLALAPWNVPVTVAVNPAQLPALERYCRELVVAVSSGRAVRLAGCADVGPGGARLVSPGGSQIDATIETQLANLARALVGDGASGAAADSQTDQGRYQSDSERVEQYERV